MITFFFKNNLTLKFFIMAILKMGALVTEIVGSLGGNAFKRQRGTQVMFKKSNGASRSKVLNNKTLSQKSQIFKTWNSLTTEVKAAWNFEATKYQFPNKFGDMVNLTGIQLQRKLQIQLSPVTLALMKPDELDSYVIPFTIYQATINWGTNDFNIEITVGETPIKIAIMVEISTRSLNAPSFVRRGIMAVPELYNESPYNFIGDLYAKYPFVNSNYNMRVYLYAINEFGFVSVQQTLDVTVL
jgi:hypothetical protein